MNTQRIGATAQPYDASAESVSAIDERVNATQQLLDANAQRFTANDGLSVDNGDVYGWWSQAAFKDEQSKQPGRAAPDLS